MHCLPVRVLPACHSTTRALHLRLHPGCQQQHIRRLPSRLAPQLRYPHPRHAQLQASQLSTLYSKLEGVEYDSSSTSSQEELVQVPEDSLAVDAVFRTSKGLWRIRPYSNSDYQAVVRVQTDGFHESNPVGMIDSFTYKMFEAEVVDALRQKFKYSKPNTFQMLVAEEVVESSSGVHSADAQGTSTASTSSTATGTPSSEQPSTGTCEVVGVVEVSLSSSYEVASNLPDGVTSYAYVSSMAVKKSVRRRGVAWALMQAVEQQCLLWCQPYVALHVYKDNIAGLQLYTACGLYKVAEDPPWKSWLGARSRLLLFKDLIRDGPAAGGSQ